MVKNPLIRTNPKKVRLPRLNKSKGILDDYAVRKTIDTQEGTCIKAAVDPNDIVNKAYGDANYSAGTGDVTAAANLTDVTLVQGDGGAKGIKTTTVTAGEVAANTTFNTAPYDFPLTDDTADIFKLTTVGGGICYMCVTTTNAAEKIDFGDGRIVIETAKNTMSQPLEVTGNISVTGNVDGVDIAGMSGSVTSNSLHRGDATGADHSTLVSNVLTNTGKSTNVTTNLSAGTRTATTIDVNSSDGTNATLVEADTTNAGILGSDKWDEIVANSNKNTNVSTNLSMGTVDGTQYNINSSDGNNVALSLATTDNWGIISDEMFDQLATAVTHYGDNTQAHSDYLLNSGADVAVGPLTTTADNSTADQAYVPMVLYNTDDTPPAASGFPVGTIYIQYTA